MKQLVLICLLFCFCTSGYSQNTPPPPPLSKSRLIQQIEVTQKPSYIEINFAQTLKNVSITAKCNDNPIYTNTVNTSPGKLILINTANWATGTYLLRIINENGALMGEYKIFL